MRIHPGYRFSLCFKKAVDDDRFKLIRGSSTKTSRFAASDRRSGIDCGARFIGENNFAAIRDSLGIDRAMSGAQTSTGAGVFRALACPVTRNARQDRVLAGKSGRCQP